MECDECRDLISARQDGEMVDDEIIEAHLVTCAPCRDWEQRSHRLARAGLAVAEVAHVSVMPQARTPGSLVDRWLRIMLAWVGVALVVWNISGVLETGADPGAVHLARHQSAFAVALGVAFLYVAWRSDRAYGLVPFAVTFAVAVTAVAVVDLVTGSANASRESLHFLELAGLVMLWTLGVRVGPGRIKSGRG
jgi:predicted anti-sigma-YlaC factor YlaD